MTNVLAVKNVVKFSVTNFKLILLGENHEKLRWSKSRDSYRRIASESYRCDSNR